MDGILFLEGYKLKHRINLNLQKHTVLLSHSDMFTPVILFDLIERYFNKRNFSDTYLEQGIHIRLNEKTLAPMDFQVWRISPWVNIEEEIKIVKKTLLGQYLEQLYRDKEDVFMRIEQTIEAEILHDLNEMLSSYDMRISCDEQNIFNFAKMLSLGTYLSEEAILSGEYSQFQAKKFLLDMIDRLQTKKPKLLLVELPEYGLDQEELRTWVELFANTKNIANSIIYTQSPAILSTIDDIYAYHLCKDYRVMGFDDYDEMEDILLDFTGRQYQAEEIKKQLLIDLFDEKTYERKYKEIDKIFRI